MFFVSRLRFFLYAQAANIVRVVDRRGPFATTNVAWQQNTQIGLPAMG